jgi:hypothetical protein
VKVKFSGVVSDVEGAVPEGIAGGAPFSGSLAYDPDDDEHPIQYQFELPEESVLLQLDIEGMSFEGDWRSDRFQAWYHLVFVDPDDPDNSLPPDDPDAVALMYLFATGPIRLLDTGELFWFSLHSSRPFPSGAPAFLRDDQLPTPSGELLEFIRDGFPNDGFQQDALIYIGNASEVPRLPDGHSLPDLFPYPCGSGDDGFCIEARIEDATAVSIVEIAVASRPSRRSNTRSRFGRRLLRVFLFGSGSFDVSNIDRSTLAFGPAGAAPVHRKGGHQKNVNRDRFPDLVSHYRFEDVGFSPWDEQLCATGESFDGTAFEGCLDYPAALESGPGPGRAFDLRTLMWLLRAWPPGTR